MCGRIDPASPRSGHMDGNATMSAHQAHCSRASSWRMVDMSSTTSIPFSQPSHAQANGGGHMPAPSIGGGKPPMRAQETHTGTARMSSQSAQVDGAAVMAEHQMQYSKTPEAVEEMICGQAEEGVGRSTQGLPRSLEQGMALLSTALVWLRGWGVFRWYRLRQVTGSDGNNAVSRLLAEVLSSTTFTVSMISWRKSESPGPQTFHALGWVVPESQCHPERV